MHDMSAHAAHMEPRPASFASMSSASTTKSSASSITRWPWSPPSSAWCSPGSCASIWACGSFAIPGLHLLSKTGAPGDVMTPEYYLQLMTMHGTIMVFFVLTTAPFAAFGNFFLPIQSGAEDMPFPHFNMMSFWVTFVGFLVLVASFFVGDGPTLGGWTQYAPLSAIGAVCRSRPGSGRGSLGSFDWHFLHWPVAGFA